MSRRISVAGSNKTRQSNDGIETGDTTTPSTRTFVQKLSKMHTGLKNLQRFRSRPKIIIDIYAGDHSIAKYYLRKDQRAKVLSIDIRDKEDALRTVPKHLWSRIHYVGGFDVRNLTMDKLNELLQEAWGASLDDVYHIHASPDCRTLSTADGSKVGIKEGRSHYRKPDGTLNASAPQHRQQRVRDADEAMNHVLSMFVKIAQKHSIMLLTVENPKGFFAEQPMVKSMLQSSQNWRLLEGNYCKAADPRYDGDNLWSMKPTHFLIRGGQPDLELPKCNFDCKFRIGDSNRHRVSIRIDKSSDPQQVKLEGHSRHAIPGGLLDIIHTSHEKSVKSLEHDMQQAPAGMFAYIDESHERKCITATCTNERMLLYNFDRDSLIATNKARKEEALEKKWQLIHARYGHQGRDRIGKKIKGLHKAACPVCNASKTCRKAHKGSISRGKYAMHL